MMPRRIALTAVAVVALAFGAVTGSGASTSKHTKPNRALIRAGALAVAQAGCAACHRIGNQGNDGPGPALTKIGAHLSPAAIRRALDNPRPPMP